VAPARDPAVHVSLAGHFVSFYNLGCSSQERADGVQLALGDLEADEGEDGEAGLAEVDIETGGSENSGALEPVEAGLHGGTGDPETPGKLQDRHTGSSLAKWRWW